MTPTVRVIALALERCDAVARGFDDVLPDLDGRFPIDASGLAGLDRTQRDASVALLKRYEQLQDLLGRAFRALMSQLGKDAREMYPRDTADNLERLLIADRAEDWMQLLRLRNRLVNENPIETDEQVTRLNETWDRKGDLVMLLARLRDKCREKGVFDD